MFWHNFKYELITCFRVKDVLFWLMLFPIVLGLFFKAAFSGIYDKDFSNAAIKTAVVETTENENFSAVLDSLSSGRWSAPAEDHPNWTWRVLRKGLRTRA